MKRILILLSLLFSGLFYSLTPAIAGAASLGITGGGAKTIGDTFDMTATLGAAGNKVCVANFTITYPADLLELKSSSLGSPFSMAIEQSSSAGAIHYQIGAPSCSTADATLLNMSFNAKAVGDATVAFSLGELTGGDDGQLTIEASKGSAAVNIAAVAAAPSAPTTTKKTTPKKTTTTTPVPTAPVVTVKDPALSVLGYASDVVLDNVGNKAKGITFSGTADPSVKINIVIASDPIIAFTTSDATGNWNYTLSDWLEAGQHKITLVAEKDSQKSKEVITDFVIGTEAKNQIAIGTTLPEKVVEEVPAPTAQTPSKKLSPMTIAMIGGGSVLFLIIILILEFLIKRKRYLQVATEMSGSIRPDQAGIVSMDDGQLSMPSGVDLSQVMPPKTTQPEAQNQSQEVTSQVQTAQPVQSVQTPVSVNPEVSPTSQVSQEMAPVAEPIAAVAPNPTKSPELAVNEIGNVKTDTGEMTLDFNQNPQAASLSQAPTVEQKEVSVASANIPTNQSLPPSDITFDNGDKEEEKVDQNPTANS